MYIFIPSNTILKQMLLHSQLNVKEKADVTLLILILTEKYVILLKSYWNTR